MKKVMVQYEDGEMSWTTVDQVLDYAEQCSKNTLQTTRDWRKRLEVKAGKKLPKSA